MFPTNVGQRIPMTFRGALAVALVALSVASCGDIRLLATETPPPSPPAPVAPAPPTSSGIRGGDPICGEYDDYQGASMAFYSLSAIVQQGLDTAPAGSEGETLAEAAIRFANTIRAAAAGEAIQPSDPIEELALLWVASDGCMR